MLDEGTTTLELNIYTSGYSLKSHLIQSKKWTLENLWNFDVFGLAARQKQFFLEIRSSRATKRENLGLKLTIRNFPRADDVTKC